MDWCSHLGSVWMRPSLEVDDTIGITRARFCVFFHRPLLGHCRRLVGVLTQLHVRVLGGQAGREANVLPDQPPTAAPDKNRISLNWLSSDHHIYYTHVEVFLHCQVRTIFPSSVQIIWRGKNEERGTVHLFKKKRIFECYNIVFRCYHLGSAPYWI